MKNKYPGVKIDKNCKIYPGVSIGNGTVIEGPSIIGKPSRSAGKMKTIIGKNCYVRAFTTIYTGTVIGDDCATGHGVLIRENNSIGNKVSIGTNTVLEPDNIIGNNVRIHSSCFLEMVRIRNNVFIGPNVVFTDDPHPPCPRFKDCKGGAIIEDFAKIGANSTILPGVKIGENSLVGAGSVVVKDVSGGTVVAGNPSKEINKLYKLKCVKHFFKSPYIKNSIHNVK